MKQFSGYNFQSEKSIMPAMTIFVAIALGSNIGKADENIRNACPHLADFIKELRLSALYTSAPMYFPDQAPFVNAVAVGFTTLEPRELLIKIKDIETEMGREVTFRNGPRLIDLDIILYGDKMVMREDLQIPHPRMGERPFVMRPLADLAPEIIHPVTGQTMREMAEQLIYNDDGLHVIHN